jgi:hypothetical protein
VCVNGTEDTKARTDARSAPPVNHFLFALLCACKTHHVSAGARLMSSDESKLASQKRFFHGRRVAKEPRDDTHVCLGFLVMVQ